MSVSLSQKAAPITPPLLGPDEPPPFTILNPEGKARCILLCDHASNRIPQKLGDLGLDEAELQKHAAWDIGVDYITRQMAAMLDAPALLVNYSRLVVDVNRRLDHPTAFVTHSEGKPVPGNLGLDQTAKDMRANEIYIPYHKAVEEMINGFTARDIAPAVISIHSYTKKFYNQTRPWEIGVLWVQDPRLPVATMDYFKKKGFTVGDNEPYDARILRGTTVNYHADDRGLPNALIEVRNDLIDTDEKGHEWAEMLADCYRPMLEDDSLFTYYDGPRVAHDPGRERSYFEELIEKAKQGD